MQDKNLFAVVLIDPAGAIFLDELFRDPKNGGKLAFERLHNAVSTSLASYNVRDAHCVPMLVKVYADLETLAERLLMSGIIESKDDLTTFSRAFVDSYPYCEFINTEFPRAKMDSEFSSTPDGHTELKEAGMLSYYDQQVQCKKIYFAGCPNGHYNVKLQALRHVEDPRALDKIALVEITPASQKLLRYGYDAVRFDNVFRREPLTAKYYLDSTFFWDPISTLWRGMPERMSSNISRGPFSDHPPSASSPAPRGYKPMTLDEFPPRTIFFNDNNQRLDPIDEIPPPGPLGTYNFALRTLRESGGTGFCTAHYINGHCKRGDECPFEHRAKLTGPEVEVLLHEARKMDCVNGSRCDDFDCVASHHCPYTPRGVSCHRMDCEFLHLGPEEWRAR